MHPKRELQKTNFMQRWKFSRVFPGLQLLLGGLVIVLSLTSLVKLYSAGFFWSNQQICRSIYAKDNGGNVSVEVSLKLQEIKKKVVDMQGMVEKALEDMHKEVSEGSKELQSECMKYSRLLVDVLTPIESVKQFLDQVKIPGVEILSHGIATNSQNLEPTGEAENATERPILTEDFFHIEEIRKYITVKGNRLGRPNFMGANGTFPTIGHGCFLLKEELEEYMSYDIGDYCEDDWKLAQRLMVRGCDPLPRRRCFAKAPKYYQKPYPINESLWRLPDDRNVRWDRYQCKNFSCLANNKTRKGFFKCAECFNLTKHELPRWMHIQNGTNPQDFLIVDVLNIKPGEIRIGLDFSIGTGTFAARMREFNVTIVTATINLGAPFSEMIALRGLVPLYLTVNQRLPFFDNTLDLIHTTRFLDSWIDLQLLDFIVFDWDRILRPGGLLWIDSFFCAKKDLDHYQYIILQLRYKQHKWIVAPKRDKSDDEVFFSAVLEKPPRPF